MIGNLKNIQNLHFNYEHTTRTIIKTVESTAITKKRIDMQITEKKMVLEKYYQESIIMSTFSIEGVKATRKTQNQKNGNIVIQQINSEKK